MKPFVLPLLFSSLVCFSGSPLYAAYDEKMGKAPTDAQFDVHIGLLYLQPTNNDLKYAVFVFNTQPYDQDWAYQVVNPAYSPSFEVGGNYAFANSPYHLSLDWLSLNTSDFASKQANPAVSLANVEFVAPPADVGPAVFGIKHAYSKALLKLNNVGLHAGRAWDFDNGTLRTILFSGINFLAIKQTVTTRFRDNPGALPTSVTYPTEPDPIYSFQTKNTSDFVGAGPDFGIDVRYRMKYGFSLISQAQGLLAVGRIKSNDKFRSTSARLVEVGIPLSHQSLSMPDMTQVVPGLDTKLGVGFQFVTGNLSSITIEAGYRVAAFINAISNVRPASLVQVGKNTGTPEFATGTMAIQSTESHQSTLSINGPYIDLRLRIG